MLKVIPVATKTLISGIGQGALSIEYHKNIFQTTAQTPFSHTITYLENTTLQTLVDHG